MKRLYLPIRNAFLLLIAVCAALAQQAAFGAGLSFDQLAARAGIIFSGTVEKVDSSDGSVIHVTFSVDEGIRGVFSGQTLTISEWKTSMTATPRYRSGEKLLIFLHTPSQNGLTSPVGGNAGVVRFVDTENMKLTPEQALALKRSARLRSAMTGTDAAASALRVPASDLVRALRLVTSSQ
jgi:hypothetical protein